jgi:hypothetical protein
VREAHDANASFVKCPDSGNVFGRSLRSFHAEEQSDLAADLNLPQVFLGSDNQHAGISRNELIHEIDLRECPGKVKARLRARTIYRCRHTFAALQLSRGENPQYVAHQMGHTNLEMIIRHHARVVAETGTCRHSSSPSFRQIPASFARKLPENGRRERSERSRRDAPIVASS